MARVPKKPAKKPKNGYKMPEPIPKGTVLTDIAKKQWRLGSAIGLGGFGEIYEAQDASKPSTKYPFAVKIEPHENGPLFVEIHFYMKNAKAADIDAFKKKHSLKSLGMPVYLGSGSYELASSQTKYRFIVMEKFGNDVDKLRKTKELSGQTVFQIASQIVSTLEYIHDLGYTHGDIKGGNVLVGISGDSKGQWYLVDFGLATKYSTDKEFKPDPKKAHNGTIEYLSRDAHYGVATRRGDLEILGYNIIHWLGGSLPWDSKLADPKVVQAEKEKAMNEIPSFVKQCFVDNNLTSIDFVIKYLQLVNKLKFNEKPDYSKVCKILEDAEKKGTTKKRRSLRLAQSPEKTSSEDEQPVKSRRKIKNELTSPPDGIMNDEMKEILAKKKANGVKKQQSKKVKEVLENNSSSSPLPTVPKKKSSRNVKKIVDVSDSEEDDIPIQPTVTKKQTSRKPKKTIVVESQQTEDDFAGFTPAMIEIKKRQMNNDKLKTKTGVKSKKKVEKPEENSSKPQRKRGG